MSQLKNNMGKDVFLDKRNESHPLEKYIDIRRRVPTDLLKKSSLSRLIQYCIVDWVVIVGCWYGISISSQWFYPLWIMIIAGRFHSFGAILHDTIHISYHKKSFGLYIIEIFCGYPIASTLNAMRYHHLRHHGNNGMPNDPYFKPHVHGRPLIFILIWLRHIILIPLWITRGFYGLLSLAFPRMRTSYARVFLQDRSGQDLTNKKEVLACARAEFGQVIFHTILFAFTILHFKILLFCYYIPVTITGLLAGYRILMEHVYIPVTDRSVPTILDTTNNHNLGVFGQLFFAPRNIGYHAVHHLHPQVASHQLPYIHSWYLKHFPEFYPRTLQNH